jgi:hypothetical protein
VTNAMIVCYLHNEDYELNISNQSNHDDVRVPIKTQLCNNAVLACSNFQGDTGL